MLAILGRLELSANLRFREMQVRQIQWRERADAQASFHSGTEREIASLPQCRLENKHSPFANRGSM